MIQLCWNCHGLGQSMTKQALKELIRKYRPSLIFLSETRMKDKDVKSLRKECKFPYGTTVKPIKTAGGLAMWWDNTVSVQILSKSKFLIDTVVKFKCDDSLVCFSWFYGPPDKKSRPGFWNSCANLAGSFDLPWLCAGDFNEFLWPHEKEGGNPWNPGRRRFLREFMEANDLIELQSKGQKLTWCNNWYDGGLIKIKLDRGVVNTRWLERWPDSYSDPTTVRGPKLFKFEPMWVDDLECRDVVEASWTDNSPTVGAAQWVTRSQRCSHDLSKWSKTKFANNRKAINSRTEELQVIQESTSAEARNRESFLIGEIHSLWKKEEKYWTQRSRVNWLKAGDSNTKFFHLTTIQRRQRNKVLKLKSASDVWLDREGTIRSEVENYFKDIFKSSGERDWDEALRAVAPVTSPEMNSALTKEFTAEEVKEAAFHMGADKAPGPDGFHGIFFQNFWNIINETMSATATEFHETAHILSDLNKTNIVLIPKIPCPEKVDQFHPISLCNYSYKILSKMLANRLKEFLPSIISPHQCAFVPGRQIQDNILVAHEAFHYLKLRKSGDIQELALKLDMSKAYDRVEWD
ncbi:putative RNA-directed DNA polymerase [Rosa chinensis]|uniref:Putative RNA-directed DNA polymerase n=1 Tax=Rosa chinensis TaxID=74649 RepID=A0A2P6Q982_ROSCH|nr:putative RNA-directed DNA polymerase [Rosa chinensis]